MCSTEERRHLRRRHAEILAKLSTRVRTSFCYRDVDELLRVLANTGTSWRNEQHGGQQPSSK
jgi:hypothetical protein